jgi:hypothetical protein
MNDALEVSIGTSALLIGPAVCWWLIASWTGQWRKRTKVDPGGGLKPTFQSSLLQQNKDPIVFSWVDKT